MEPEEYCIIMKKKPAFLCENIIAGKKEKDKVLVQSFHTRRKM